MPPIVFNSNAETNTYQLSLKAQPNIFTAKMFQKCKPRLSVRLVFKTSSALEACCDYTIASGWCSGAEFSNDVPPSILL